MTDAEFLAAIGRLRQLGEEETRRDPVATSLARGFYGALSGGERRRAHRIAKRLLKLVEDPVARSRWRKWAQVTRFGHRGRIVVMSHPAEFLVGDDLVAVQAAERFLGSDERIADALEKLKEES